MPAGRPTKYNKAILEKANEYLNGDSEDVVLSAVGLACYLNVTKSTVYLWGDEHKEFSDTLGKVQGLQERQLVNNGVTGDWNSTITKLMLANHGYHEKQDIKQSGELEIKTIERVIVRPENTDS